MISKNYQKLSSAHNRFPLGKIKGIRRKCLCPTTYSQLESATKQAYSGHARSIMSPIYRARSRTGP